MAKRGPKPKTTATAPRVASPRDGWDAPGHLSEGAKAAWVHVVGLLASKGNLSRTDPNLVECYAVNVDLIRLAQAGIKNDGMFVKNGMGALAPHPGVALVNSATMRIKAIVNDLGLCPSSSKHAAATAGSIAETKAESKWDGLLGVTG
jgi:P27 family predicted phage terminase small subunit